MIEPVTECVVDTGIENNVAMHNHAPEPIRTDTIASMNSRS